MASIFKLSEFSYIRCNIEQKVRSGPYWQKLENLIIIKDVVNIYKILNEQTCSENLKDLVQSWADVSVRTTRAVEAGQLHLPKVHTERARRFFAYRAAASWNRAAPSVREAPTARSCGRRIKGTG